MYSNLSEISEDLCIYVDIDVIVLSVSFLMFRRNFVVIVYLSLAMKESRMKILITHDVYKKAMTLVFHGRDCFSYFIRTGLIKTM